MRALSLGMALAAGLSLYGRGASAECCSSDIASALLKPGVSVTREQESRIRAGMTSAEVLAIAGPPAARFRYRVEPGPTWSYQVSGRLPNNYSFDVQFDDAGRVVSASERYTPAG